MTIASFDKVTLRALRSDIEDALKGIAAKHGISMKLETMRFQANVFSAKIEGATRGEDGQATSREAEAFTKYAELFGLKAEDLGRKILLGGKPYTITGLRPNAPKRPVMLTDAQGRSVVTNALSVQVAPRV